MKWYSYIICFLLIIVGTFCGIRFFQELKAESYINGSIDISNQFSQECFSYSSLSVVFYHDTYDDETNDYIFETDLLKTENFDGLEKKYKVTLNDYVLFVPQSNINLGSINATVDFQFYGTEGQLLVSPTLDISIKFLSNKTKLTLKVVGEENKSFMEQYFADYGIRLDVTEIF